MNKWAFWLLMGLVVTIPLESMLIFPGIGSFSRLIGIFVAVFGLLAIVVGKHIRKFETIQILLIVYLLWSLVTYFWSVDYVISYKSILTLSQLVFFSFLIWQFSTDEKHQQGLMSAYILGALISCLGIIFDFLHHQTYDYFRYSAYGFDPNDIGLTMALAIPMSWYLSLVNKNKLFVLLYRAIVIILFLGTVLTASRGAFIALAVSSLFIFWSIPKSGLLNKVGLIVFIAVGATLVLKFVPSSSWERIGAIGSEISSGSLSGRLTIWREGINAFLHNPIFGVGIGGFKTGVEATLGRQAAPHNLFIGVLVGQGIVGLFIFLAILFSMFVGTFSMSSLLRKFWLVLLATWCAGVMSLSWELRKPTWFLIGLAAVQISLARNDSGATGSEGLKEEQT